MYKEIVTLIDGMSNNRYKAIFLYLLRKEEFVTSTQIADVMGVTERTIKNDIKNLRKELEYFEGVLSIESKPSLGYILKVQNLELKNELKKHYRIYQPQIVDSDTDVRVDYILRRLLSMDDNEYIALEKIHEELYIGQANNLQKEMKKVKQILSDYKLNLLIKPHYGMKVEGSAISQVMLSVRLYKYFDKRIKVDFHIEQYNQKFFAREEDYRRLRYIVYESIRSSNIVLNDIYAERLLVYLSYLKNNKSDIFDSKLQEEIFELQSMMDFSKTEEFKFIDLINNKLKKELRHYELREHEKIFLSMITIMSTDLYRYSDCNVSRYGRLIPLTEQIIDDMNEYLTETIGLNIYSDPTCYKDMTKLMIPVSLKVFLQISDDVDLGFYNMDIQERKPLLYRYVEKMSIFFSSRHAYNFSIREKYLIFNVLKGMVDRIQLPTRPLKLAIIAINGRLSTQHLKFNLKHHYADYIERIDTRVLYDLEMEDSKKLDYDYYLCMDYGKNMNIPFKPIYYADESLSENDYTESLSKVFIEAHDYDRHLPPINLVKLNSKSHLKTLEISDISDNPQKYQHFVLDENNSIHLYFTSSESEFFDIYSFEKPELSSIEGIRYILKIGIDPKNAVFKIKMLFKIIDNIVLYPHVLDEVFYMKNVTYSDFYTNRER